MVTLQEKVLLVNKIESSLHFYANLFALREISTVSLCISSLLVKYQFFGTQQKKLLMGK